MDELSNLLGFDDLTLGFLFASLVVLVLLVTNDWKP